MRAIKATALALAAVLAASPVAGQDRQEIPKEIADAVKSLHPQHGKVTLEQARATLDLGNAYDYYSPSDAKTILTTIWNNPPSAADGVLGLVMPAGKSPLSDAWGAVITYEASGYVSDADAASVDYDAILTQLREGEAESNAQRKADGYPEMTLVGWAEKPSYDKASHSVVWARDLKTSDSQTDSLNYDVRNLGRGGVLSLNLISSMANLNEVKAAAHEFMRPRQFRFGRPLCGL